jgi:hypothetical protein
VIGWGKGVDRGTGACVFRHRRVLDARALLGGEEEAWGMGLKARGGASPPGFFFLELYLKIQSPWEFCRFSELGD